MKNYNYILFLVAAAPWSCTPSDPVINSFQDQWRFVVADARGLASYSMPSGELLNPAVWRMESASEQYPVSVIKSFRDQLFAIITQQPWIIVLDKKTLSVLDTIDLGTYGTAADIAFANASTAYVTFATSAYVGVVDITTFKLASTISLPDVAAGIAVAGNQLCAALPKLNQAVILDSRTNSVEATLSIPSQAPFFAESDGLVGVFVVVSLGAGKLPFGEQVPTTPTMTFIEIADRSILKTIDLTARASEGPQQIVKSLVVNAGGFSFTPVQSGLLRVGNAARNRAAAVQFINFGFAAYDAARAELICVYPDGKSIDVFSEYGDMRKTSVILPDSITAVAGIAP